MKSTRFATLCAAIGLVSILSFDSRAAVYSDPSNDLFDTSLSNLDITGVEVTNNGVNLSIAVTTRGFATWTKYLIWIDTPGKVNAASNSNGWGRPAAMVAGEGADFFIGSWVDATPGNAQLWEFASAWNQHSSSPLTNLVAGNTVTFTIPLSTLGLNSGDLIKLDVATSGGGSDPGVDHASRSTSATTGWGNASTGGSMLAYTVATLADSDSDGLTDSWENTYFGDLAQDGSGDPDNDGLINSGELTAGTNPIVADTDADGLNDGAEVGTHTTNPTVADTDGDGVNDGAEVTVGTNPKKTNYSQITAAGGFQGWSPAPAGDSSNVMSRIAGDEFGWELNFRMATVANYAGKFTTGSWAVNWGTSSTPGVLQLGGFGNDIPFNVTATGVWRFYFNTDTLAYSFARAAAPATYADWAAQYGLAADSGSEDTDSDTLTNTQEFAANTDPSNTDTDGDGISDSDETSGAYANLKLGSPLLTNPLTGDTDADGLPDKWELDNYLDPTDNGIGLAYTNYIPSAYGLTVTSNPNGAGSNPDGDALTNLQEFSGGKNPLVAEGDIASTYAKVVVAGSFVQTKPDGSWDEVGNALNTMQLVSNFTWKLIAYVPSPLPSFAQFKFTTGSWSTNFGDNIPVGGSADGVGDPNGSNINALPVFTTAGYYTITFNDFSKAYTITPLAVADADSDGLPDEWEAFYGGYLNPKITDLTPETAYVSGSTTTAAQAFAAGTNPVVDTVAPSVVLAVGTDKLVWLALNSGSGQYTGTAADVVATDNIGTPSVVVLHRLVSGSNPGVFDAVDTSAPGLWHLEYTATDGSGNAVTSIRVVVVGDVAPGWRAMVWPPTMTINVLGSGDVYGQVYVDGATAAVGAAPNIQAWVGVSTANTDPSTWDASAWNAAVFNAQSNANDEYKGTISGAGLIPGTPYYYAYRWQIGAGAYTYGGIKADGSGAGPWDGTTNVNGVLTVQGSVGSTFSGWSGGATLDSANLGMYAIGGASSLSATDGVEPSSTVSGGSLVLTAIVRVDDPKLSVFGEVVTSLANYGTPAATTMIDGADAADQTGVPAGHKRQTFTVLQGADSRKFLRLKATLQP
jgi:hypothetical protein